MQITDMLGQYVVYLRFLYDILFGAGVFLIIYATLRIIYPLIMKAYYALRYASNKNKQIRAGFVLEEPASQSPWFFVFIAIGLVGFWVMYPSLPVMVSFLMSNIILAIGLDNSKVRWRLDKERRVMLMLSQLKSNLSTYASLLKAISANNIKSMAEDEHNGDPEFLQIINYTLRAASSGAVARDAFVEAASEFPYYSSLASVVASNDDIASLLFALDNLLEQMDEAKQRKHQLYKHYSSLSSQGRLLALIGSLSFVLFFSPLLSTGETTDVGHLGMLGVFALLAQIKPHLGHFMKDFVYFDIGHTTLVMVLMLLQASMFYGFNLYVDGFIGDL